MGGGSEEKDSLHGIFRGNCESGPMTACRQGAFHNTFPATVVGTITWRGTITYDVRTGVRIT